MQVLTLPKKRYENFQNALLKRKNIDESESYLIYGFPWMQGVDCSNKAAIKNAFRGDTEKLKALLEELEIQDGEYISRTIDSQVWIFILVEVGRQVPEELWLLEQVESGP